MDISKFNKDYMAFIKKAFYEKKIPDSCIDESECIRLIKAAVKESIPTIKQETEGKKLYGLSFELSNTVDKSSYYSYSLGLHFNTEEFLAENCGSDDPDYSYFRYGMWGEWMTADSDTESSKILQEYLYQNRTPSDSDVDISADEMSEEEKAAFEWYSAQYLTVDDKQNEERSLIRKCVTLAVAELNNEKFFCSCFGEVNLYPFSGECTPKKEEILEHYSLMANETPDEKYIEYIRSQE